MKKYKVYAYVTAECCVTRNAERPGAEVGRNRVPVSRHGDYEKWPYGKRETLALAAGAGYKAASAREVARLMRWEVARG